MLKCTSFQVRDRGFLDVSLAAEELNIPGLHLFHDFVNLKEEEVGRLLAL